MRGKELGRWGSVATKVPESKTSFLASLCRRRMSSRPMLSRPFPKTAPSRCLRFILGVTPGFMLIQLWRITFLGLKTSSS